MNLDAHCASPLSCDFESNQSPGSWFIYAPPHLVGAASAPIRISQQHWSTTINRLEELGFYTLAGQAKHPRALIDEVQQAEQAGLGHCFISERWNTKEAATISGAVGAVSSSISIATAATNTQPAIPSSPPPTQPRCIDSRVDASLSGSVEASSHSTTQLVFLPSPPPTWKTSLT